MAAASIRRIWGTFWRRANFKKRFLWTGFCWFRLLRRPIRTVAICGGAGDFLLQQAIALGADAFITGEMHYHQYFGYEQKLQICVVGHYESEQFTTEIFHDIITSECQGLNVVMAHTKTNPITHPTL